MAHVAAARGDAQAVAVVAAAEGRFDILDRDWGVTAVTLVLQLPAGLYAHVVPVEPNPDSREEIEIVERLTALAIAAWRGYSEYRIVGVTLAPAVVRDADWRASANAWLRGEGINNQGRVRSNNIASREADGLLFRSMPEIHLYRALKASGAAFAPLPVWIRGGEQYRRIEPDFLVWKDGVLMMIEVDGDTVHTESPAEAHERTTMLVREGALLERVLASTCDTPERARACATRLLQILDRAVARR